MLHRVSRIGNTSRMKICTRIHWIINVTRKIGKLQIHLPSESVLQSSLHLKRLTNFPIVEALFQTCLFRTCAHASSRGWSTSERGAIIASNGGNVRRMLRVDVINRAWQGEEKIEAREEAWEIFQISSCHDLEKDTSEVRKNLPTKGGLKASETGLTSTRGFSSGTRQSNGRI